MNIIKLSVPVFLLSILSLTSCDKDDEVDCDIKMKFQNYEGLEDCGILLTVDLDDEWRTLEPINIEDFDIVPTDGLEVCGEFIVRTDIVSTCQVGEIVELKSLTLR